MEAEGKAVLVGTGSFTVDRARALEKLMRFALPDPAWGVLSLVRFAVASKASFIKVERAARGELTVRFDGTPPAREQLEGPYDALFARAGKAEPRGRDLAVGLLSLLRLEPAHILVRAGHGGERLLLRLNRAEPEAVEPCHDGDEDTVVRFIPGPGTPAGVWAAVSPAVEERCRMLPPDTVLSIDGEPWKAPRAPEGEEGRPVFGPDLAGWVRYPERREAESRIRLYRLGVLVCEISESLGGAPVMARVDCAAFRLNASQTAVVRDPAFKRAMAAVAAAAAALVPDAAATHAERAPQLTQILKGMGLRGLWGRSVAAWLEPARPRFVDALGNILGAASEQALDRQLAAAVKADARRACWLREAGDAARDAPVFLAPDLTAQSRAQLEETVAALGVLPVADRLNAAPRDYHVLWTSCPAERSAAQRWFPGAPVAAADDALAFEGRAAAGGGNRRGSLLSRLGIVEAVARRPLTGEWEGELSLPLQRPDAARVHIFVGEELVQSITVEGPLRFVAALVARGPLRAQAAKSAVAAVSKVFEDLYAGAASDWSPGASSSSGEALRAHLFDALAHWGDHAPAWLETLPLFQCELGMFGIRAVEKRLNEGDTLFFAPRAPRGAAPQLLFTHPSLTPALLGVLFSHEVVLPLPGRPDWTAVWRERPAAARRKTGLTALEDLLREHGTFLAEPDGAQRRYLLETVVVNFAPWGGEPREDARWARVREHLEALPLFRGGDGKGLTPPELASRAASGRPVELVLNERERAAFEALWPGAGAALAAAVETDIPAPGEAPAAGPRKLAFNEPMLVAREVESEGLRALVGLPPEPLPGIGVTVVGAGEPLECVLDTPGSAAAGRMLLDVSGWQGPGLQAGGLHKELAKAARELYIAFLGSILDGVISEGLRPYLLMAATARKGAAGPWAPLRKRIDELPLFPTLGGKTASLADMRKMAAKDVLRCARRAEEAPPEAADVPIVTTRALAEAALGLAIHEWTAEAVAPAAGTGLESRLEKLLTRVRGRKGLDPALAPRRGTLRLEKSGGKSLFEKEGPTVKVDAEHPAARLALAAGLDETARAAYLLSALATAVNRTAAATTDAEDALFQALLAEAAAEES